MLRSLHQPREQRRHKPVRTDAVFQSFLPVPSFQIHGYISVLERRKKKSNRYEVDLSSERHRTRLFGRIRTRDLGYTDDGRLQQIQGFFCLSEVGCGDQNVVCEGKKEVTGRKRAEGEKGKKEGEKAHMCSPVHVHTYLRMLHNLGHVRTSVNSTS